MEDLVAGQNGTIIMNPLQGTCGTLHEAVPEYKALPRFLSNAMWPSHGDCRVMSEEKVAPVEYKSRAFALL